jgi:sugar/nucleoside kinase (ribokinase family)
MSARTAGSEVEGAVDVGAAVATAGVSRPKPREAVRTPQTTAALRNEVGAIGGLLLVGDPQGTDM